MPNFEFTLVTYVPYVKTVTVEADDADTAFDTLWDNEPDEYNLSDFTLQSDYQISQHSVEVEDWDSDEPDEDDGTEDGTEGTEEDNTPPTE